MNLTPPCSYQGAKQRVVKEIVDVIFDRNPIYNDTKFYDLCCGTGSFTLELINRGVNPNNIVMLDVSSWGKFWNSIGRGEFDLEKWNYYLNQIPQDKNEIQGFLKNLSLNNPELDEEYIYILLQAGSFGSKQIWKDGGKWNNTSFRNYWQPTETSNRKSPVNPMQPMPNTINERMKNIIENCIIYLDPPYKNTTGYGFKFDWEEFISELFNDTLAPIYVSECAKYSDDAFLLNFKGEKGGISGDRKNKHEEWLNEFR